MPLQRQHIDVRLGSLDTKVDAKTAPVGVLELVQNATRVKGGEYRRRSGRVTLAANTAAPIPPVASAFPNVWQLADYKGALVNLARGNPEGLLWQLEKSADRWQAPAAAGTQLGGPVSAVLTHIREALSSILTPIFGSESVPASPDVAIIPGTSYAVSVFETAAASGTVCEVIVDLETRKVILTNYFTGNAPKVASFGVQVTVVYITAGFINTREWTGAAVVIAVPVTGSFAALPAFGAAARADLQSYTGTIMYAYNTTALSVAFVELGPGAAAGTIATTTADLTIGWLKDFGGSGRYFLATASTSSNDVRVHVINSVGTVVATYIVDAPAVVAPYTIRNITGYSTDADLTGNFVVTWDLSHVVYQPYSKTRAATRLVGVLTTGVDWIRSIQLRSKIWRIGTRNYVLVAYDSVTDPVAGTGGLQNAYFAIEVKNNLISAVPTNSCPVLKVARDRGNGRTEMPAGLTDVELYSGRYIGALTVQRDVSAESSTVSGNAPALITTSVDLTEITPDSTLVGRPVEFADSLILPLGVLAHFDGRQVYELGFNLMPDEPSGSSLVPGFLTLGETYFWAFLFRRTDSAGRVHRGAPFYTRSVTPTVDLGFRWAVGQLKLTGREPSSLLVSPADDMAIEEYRTEGNGSVFHLVNHGANIRTVDSVNYDDGDPDTSVARATLLYTTGDVLENVSPPQLRCLVVHRERLFGVNADDLQEIWYSKPDAEGVGPGFNDALTLRVPETVTALSSMDDKLIIFTESSIYVLTGDGPDDLGEGGYAPPQRITNGVGCLLPRSVVFTPDGTWFQSPKGIYLLTRGLDAVFAGAPVTDYTATTLDTIHVPTENQVRFYQNTGNALVYDYFFKEWWVWTGQNDAAAARSANDVYTAKNVSPGLVHKDSPSVYTDAGVGYRFLLRTSWIATGGISGFGRLYEVQIVGQHVAACFARMSAYYDYLDTVSETKEVASSAPFDFSLRVARQKCAAFKLDVMDDDGAGGLITTEGFRFSGIGLDVGIKAPLNKLASSKRMT